MKFPLALTFLAACASGSALADDPGDPRLPKAPPEDANVVKVRTLRERADTHREARRFQEAVADYQAAIRLLRAGKGDHQALLLTLSGLADVLGELGRLNNALPLWEEALLVARRIHKEDHSDVAGILNNLAFVRHALGKTHDALPLFRQALAMRRRLAPDDDLEVATSLNNLAAVLQQLGRPGEALPLYQEAISMFRRVSDEDSPALASSLDNLAHVLLALGKTQDALAPLQESAAMRRRLFKGDHPDPASSLDSLAALLRALGKPEEALPHAEASLSIKRRLFKGDHPHVASGLDALASLLGDVGRHREALPRAREALSMRTRVFDGDHPNVAASLSNVALLLQKLGRTGEALPLFQDALAMYRRLFEGGHPDVATSLNNVALALVALGRANEALPLAQDALSMRRRHYVGDHPDVTVSLNTLAVVLEALRRSDDALPIFEETLSMLRRLLSEDHPRVAASLNNVAIALQAVGRDIEALRLFEEALAMDRRLFQADHPRIAVTMNNLALLLLQELGKPEEALPLFEEALATYRRSFDTDHPRVAMGLNNVGLTHLALGSTAEALPVAQASLAMYRRLFRGDHPDVAVALHNMALVHGASGDSDRALSLHAEAVSMHRRMFDEAHDVVALSLYGMAQSMMNRGRTVDARRACEEAIRIGEQVRWPDRYRPRVLLGQLYAQEAKWEQALAVLRPAADQLEGRRRRAATLGSEGRANYVTHLRSADPYPVMIRAHLALGNEAQALGVLERSRGREMLDLLQRGTEDPLHTARSMAQRRGDQALLDRIEQAARIVRDSTSSVAMTAARTTRAVASGVRGEIVAARNAEAEARTKHEQALRERLFAIREALPEGRALDAIQTRALLGDGERLLAYALGKRSFVFVVTRDGIRAHRLGSEQSPVSATRVWEAVRGYRGTLATKGATPSSATQHPGAGLFRMLFPADVWQDVRASTRVFVLPHNVLHQLPFEALVVRNQNDRPVYWAQEGPPVAYAASAAILKVLMDRPSSSGHLVVALGDPVFRPPVPWPERGVVVKDVQPQSQAARAELRPGDVILAYGGSRATAYEDLIASIRDTDPNAESVRLTYEREGVARTVSLKPGPIGVYLAREPPAVAGPRVVGRATTGVLRGGRLVRVPATGHEVRAIENLLTASAKTVKVRTLLRAQATEVALFEAATAPRVLHLATHGLIEPRKGARASRLALTPPRVPVPGNDGFLSLGDLLERWRSRLSGTDLVVLSACESHAGRLDPNEGMLALPWGFCFAGARCCIASLWSVDDESTAELMTALYRRMFEGRSLAPCEALHAARKDLMVSYPDPYHWAPFLFSGAP